MVAKKAARGHLAPAEDPVVSIGAAVASEDRADLREDKVINFAPGLWPIFDPLGPTAGPGNLGTGSGSTNSAGCATNQPRRPILRPVRGYFVFLVPAAKI